MAVLFVSIMRFSFSPSKNTWIVLYPKPIFCVTGVEQPSGLIQQWKLWCRKLIGPEEYRLSLLKDSYTEDISEL